MNDVPEGTQTLSAEKPGYIEYSSSVEVSGDVTHYVYIGFNACNVTGFVTNAIDGPIKGAKVILGNMFDYTDISGRYQFTGLPRGPDTLFVVHPNYLGFQTSVSLTSQDQALNVILKRDSVFQTADVFAYSYVDQANPSVFYPRYPDLQLLYLRANGYDNDGVYHDSIERSILAGMNFPGFLADERVTFLEATVELYTAAPYASVPIKTYAITSTWGNLVTYNTRPSLGPLLFSGSIGDNYAAKYCTVLGTDGVKALLEDYRSTGKTYGIMIKGGTIVTVGMYSSWGTQNKPRVTFKVRF